jgi:hypothetical protein
MSSQSLDIEESYARSRLPFEKAKGHNQSCFQTKSVRPHRLVGTNWIGLVNVRNWNLQISSKKPALP